MILSCWYASGKCGSCLHKHVSQKSKWTFFITYIIIITISINLNRQRSFHFDFLLTCLCKQLTHFPLAYQQLIIIFHKSSCWVGISFWMLRVIYRQCREKNSWVTRSTLIYVQIFVRIYFKTIQASVCQNPLSN